MRSQPSRHQARSGPTRDQRLEYDAQSGLPATDAIAMNDIAARFRPKLDKDWPQPLAAMLDAALAEDAHEPEHMVGRILEAWAAEETVDEAVREALRHDALAFVLSDHHGREWGDGHFGPWGSMRSESGEVITAPRRERLTEAAVEHWRSRAELLEHHVARARFSDAAWDLASVLGLKRRREDAIRAIDSYIGQCAKSDSELHLERCLSIASCTAPSALASRSPTGEGDGRLLSASS